MMGRHRSRLKILASILSAVSDNNGAKKTQIMYKAYLSYKLLARYLNDVMDAGLVICGDDDCYRLTSKGETFLAKFNKYSRFRENVDEQVNHVEDQKMVLEEMCPNSEVANGVAQRPMERDKA
jgi:predicted transcriptional regulator